MNYKFSATVVVDASSEEDALNQISGRIAAITRHLGNGEALAKSKPFFTLEKNASGAAHDMWADPIVEARRPKVMREAQVVTSADVGVLKI